MAPNVPSIQPLTYSAAPTAAAAVLNPKVIYGPDAGDNPVGLFLVLLLIVALLASGTGIFIWKLYIRSPRFGKSTTQIENKIPPKQLLLPSLHYSKHSTSSASTIEPKLASDVQTPQTKNAFLIYLRTIFKKEVPTEVEPSTDKEGEFVLVSAPIPGGDVPSIIVSTCSPSLRSQELPRSFSTDSLQVPSNRFIAPRPRLYPVVPPPLMLPPIHRPLRLVTNNTDPGSHFGPRPMSQVKLDSFGSHHNLRMDISALGFQGGEFTCSSPPRRAFGKENAPVQNGRPGHARGFSRSYHRQPLLSLP